MWGSQYWLQPPFQAAWARNEIWCTKAESFPCRSLPETASAPMKSSRPSALAGWVKYGRLATPASTAPSPSKSSRNTSRRPRPLRTRGPRRLQPESPEYLRPLRHRQTGRHRLHGAGASRARPLPRVAKGPTPLAEIRYPDRRRARHRAAGAFRAWESSTIARLPRPRGARTIQAVANSALQHLPELAFVRNF
jgi:hypothetical protein